MLFDLGWSEILLIGTVALVFIGPKDLPKAMRVAGYWVRKARTLSREFQGSIDQMIREAELDEMRQELKKAAEFDLDKEFHNTIDPTGSLREGLRPPELPNFSATSALPAAIGGNAIETAAEAPASGPDEMAAVGATPMIAAAPPEPGKAAEAEPAPPDLRPLDLSPPGPPPPGGGDHGAAPPPKP